MSNKTPILAMIDTAFSNQEFPTHSDEKGFGGFRSVSSIADRDAIPLERRKDGMLVHVDNSNRQTFILTDKDGNTYEDFPMVGLDQKLSFIGTGISMKSNSTDGRIDFLDSSDNLIFGINEDRSVLFGERDSHPTNEIDGLIYFNSVDKNLNIFIEE